MTARLDEAWPQFATALARLEKVELAEEQDSQQLVTYEIVVAAPMAKAFHHSGEYGEFIASSNAVLYPVDELKRVAPFFAGRPIFHKHDGTEVNMRTRLLNSQTRVGHLAKAWWNEDERAIFGELVVTSDYWREMFSEDAMRWKYGFSMDINILSSTAENGLDIVTKITSVFSVDMVDWPTQACGGRFADAPPLTDEQLAEQVEHLEYMRQQKMEGIYD